MVFLVRRITLYVYVLIIELIATFSELMPSFILVMNIICDKIIFLHILYI